MRKYLFCVLACSMACSTAEPDLNAHRPKKPYPQQPAASASTQPESADVRRLRDAGYTDIVIGNGPSPLFMCGKDDSIFFSSSFTAKGPSGRPVRGVLCGAMFKGATIRLE